MRRSDGTPWIHSFAHGRTIYQLKYDAKAVRHAIDKTERDHMVETIIRMALQGDLDEHETDELRDEVARRTGAKRSTLKRMLQQGSARQHKEQKAAERERRLAQRNDPRPALIVPGQDDEWLPVMGSLNEVMRRREEHLSRTHATSITMRQLLRSG